ncbi:MAG: LCP family protein [Anaerolineae bacterium]
MQNLPTGNIPEWLVYTLLGGFVVGVVALGLFTFTGVRNVVASAPLGPQGEFVGQPPGDSDSPVQIEGEPTVDPEWVEGRVTVLVMGIDGREIETGPARTDTMILVTIDPVSRRAGMISIPRDLWVQIPDYNSFDRINTAYFRGEADNYPGGGGPILAMRTVQQSVVGRPVPYYATINFQAFEDVVDEIGCIPITVPETIVDEEYPDEAYGYDPFIIEQGEHCLDGETLLKYARTRATYGADFDRAARQQQVIYAIRDHVLTTDQVPALLTQAPQIYQIAQSGLTTNLSLGQMIELARLAAEIPDENICSVVIDEAYIDPLTQADGSQVLVPIRDQMTQLIADVFNGTGQCSPEERALASEAAAENAAISVLNGTQQEGFATETANQLSAAGLTVANIANTDTSSETVIVVNGSAENTARYIINLLDLPEAAIRMAEPGQQSDYDLEILLGTDRIP